MFRRKKNVDCKSPMKWPIYKGIRQGVNRLTFAHIYICVCVYATTLLSKKHMNKVAKFSMCKSFSNVSRSFVGVLFDVAIYLYV